jgi:hypothetical protein
LPVHLLQPLAQRRAFVVAQHAAAPVIHDGLDLPPHTVGSRALARQFREPRQGLALWRLRHALPIPSHGSLSPSGPNILAAY